MISSPHTYLPMDPYKGYAAAHPRNSHGEFKRKVLSPPGFELVGPDAITVGAQSDSSCTFLPSDTVAASRLEPDGGGYVGWGTGLWLETSRNAVAASESHERATLYLRLGAPGVDPFEVFDRMTALGEQDERPESL